MRSNYYNKQLYFVRKKSFNQKQLARHEEINSKLPVNKGKHEQYRINNSVQINYFRR